MRRLIDATGWITINAVPGLDGLVATERRLIIKKKGSAGSHREEHGVDIQGEFDEIVEVVGFPQLGVGRHGCDSAG